ncbi:SDR family oxidoreductase [Novosphingobium sp. BL-52-GroH]|uniref:SDR family oxidoreductase n=1 Tax=Novosphingobium sp. BL-52-GroH TaxID=3349877 RepID=UPI00385134CF
MTERSPCALGPPGSPGTSCAAREAGSARAAYPAQIARIDSPFAQTAPVMQTARARCNARVPAIEVAADAGNSRVFYLARTPVGRIAMPQDLVGPFLFLASPLSAHMTGGILPVDGGYTVTGFVDH